MTKAYEEGLQVVVASLLDQAPFQIDVIDYKLLPRDERGHVEAERGHVGGEFVFGFLEGETHAGLVEVYGPADEEFRAEQRFATAGGAAEKGGPSPGKTAERDLIEAVNAGAAFRKTGRTLARFRGF
jgi:hypothetical protein